MRIVIDSDTVLVATDSDTVRVVTDSDTVRVATDSDTVRINLSARPSGILTLFSINNRDSQV